MANVTKTEGRKKLGVAELMCYGIGNCVGSGIFVSMGSGIGFTGRSIPVALIAACVVVLFSNGLFNGWKATLAPRPSAVRFRFKNKQLLPMKK